MPSRGKRWVELSVEVDRASVDDIVAFMERHCQGGVAVEDRSFIDERAAEGWEEATPSMPDKGGPVWVKGFLPIDDRETLQKLEIALLLLGQVSPISAPHTRILEPEEWAESWKAFFPPQRIGRHIVIVPTWREYEAQAGDIIIRLDPGMAFGTGLHPTTRLCLLALEHILSAQGAKGALTWRVLDVGTGSGILAIAAALLGASEVQAIDTDPLAVKAAQENAERNGVAGRVVVSRATLESPLSPDVPRHTGNGYDLLLVNILAQVIAAMAPAIAAALRPGGLWVASGIIAEQEQLAIDALARAGLTLDERLVQEDWIALLGHK